MVKKKKLEEVKTKATPVIKEQLNTVGSGEMDDIKKETPKKVKPISYRGKSHRIKRIVSRLKKIKATKNKTK
jgi:hypothetical protein